MPPNELLDVTAYGLRSDFLSPETMPQATVELALTKNRKLLLASVLRSVFICHSVIICYQNIVDFSTRYIFCLIHVFENHYRRLKIYRLTKRLSNAKYNFFFILDFVSPEKYFSKSKLVSNLSFAKIE